LSLAARARDAAVLAVAPRGTRDASQGTDLTFPAFVRHPGTVLRDCASCGCSTRQETVRCAIDFQIIDVSTDLDNLWQCTKCGRRFANKNQTHFCSDVLLEAHFDRKPPETRRLYEAFLGAVQSHGPVLVLPEKTRIAFQVRMSFAALMTRRGYLRGHLVLGRRRESPCFCKIETISPRNHVHVFELRDTSQLQGDLGDYIGEAYRVGCQLHLVR
jgi:hypothetical protein